MAHNDPTPLPSQIPESLAELLTELVTERRLRMQAAAALLRPDQCVHCRRAWFELAPEQRPRRRKGDQSQVS